ncbi:hypothetical protein NOR53_470 [gamma proteobacterium NOR5-3]|nr:hypothetical protein NOR53_470 [gamma proteobacterium NOR5-3]
MLITLQEGCDYLIRRNANAALGLVPAWRDHLLATWEDDRTTTIGGIPVDLSVDVYDSHRKTLRALRDSYWLAIEADLDKSEKKRVLNFVDGLPENPKLARVTRTTLRTLVKTKLGIDVPGWLPPGNATPKDLVEPHRAGTKQRNTQQMLALAARELVTRNPSLARSNGSPKLSSVAKVWIKHLQSDEKERGLTVDNIENHLREGLAELG